MTTVVAGIAGTRKEELALGDSGRERSMEGRRWKKTAQVGFPGVVRRKEEEETDAAPTSRPCTRFQDFAQWSL